MCLGSGENDKRDGARSLLAPSWLLVSFSASNLSSLSQFMSVNVKLYSGTASII